MPEKAITDKIDFNKSEQYILSIRLSTDGFSFSIYNPIRDNVVLTRQKEIEAGLSVTANMKQAFKELDFLSYAFKAVDVLLVSRRFTLIPLDLFAEEHAETCFYYNFSPRENELVLHDTLPRNEAAVLYAIDKSLHHFLSERYPQVRFCSAVSSVAEQLATKSRVGSDKKMYVCLRKSFMEVYAYERGRLMLLNAYDCKNNSDCAYYLLLAWKQLGLNQLTDELQLLGNDGRPEKMAEELKRFVQHISVSQLSTELNNN